MANFKNITDLPVAESAEGINLIVNDNGRAKQIDPKFVGASGGGEFVVKGITDFTESRWEVDKTFAEAYEAYKKGKKIVLEVYADGLPDGEYAMRLTPIYVNSESMQFIIWNFNDKQWDAMRVEFNEGNNMWICSVATIEASVYSMDVS